MKTAPFLFVAVAVTARVLASTPPPAIAAVSSVTMEVHQPQLKFEDGAWQLSGCVAPRRAAQSRVATHLDVVAFDAAGARLASTEVPLKASALRFRARAPRPHARYELPIDLISSDTARIEVRAHDDSNHQP